MVGQAWNQSSFKWRDYIQRLAWDGYPYEQLFQIHLYDDSEHQNPWTIQIKPHRDSFHEEYDKAWKGEESIEKMVQVMEKVIPDIAQDRSRMSELMAVLEFERNLTAILETCTEQYNSDCMEGADSEGAQMWLEFLNELLCPSGTCIEPSKNLRLSYSSTINTVIEASSPRTVANFIGWSLLRSSLRFMGQQGEQMWAEDFLGYSNSDREEKCLDVVGYRMPADQSFKFLLGHIITESLLSESRKTAVDSMFKSLKGQARKMVEETVTEEDDRKVILESLDALDWEFQFPPAIREPKNLLEYYGSIDMTASIAGVWIMQLMRRILRKVITSPTPGRCKSSR